MTVAGVAVPFATGRLIDTLADRRPPFGPLAVLTALLLLRTILTPLLQRTLEQSIHPLVSMTAEPIMNAVPSHWSHVTPSPRNAMPIPIAITGVK